MRDMAFGDLPPRLAAVWVVLAFFLTGPAAAHGRLTARFGGAPDPRDGPDVDVRVTIDDKAVTVQAIMNLAFVDLVAEDMPRESEWQVDPVELPGYREALFEHFAKTNKTLIDGVVVQPVDAGCDMDPGDPSMLALFPKMKGRALFKIRSILRYPAKTPPKSVALQWGTYPPDLLSVTPTETPKLRVVAHVTSAGVDEIAMFTEAEPEFIWHRRDMSPSARLLPVPEALHAKPWSVPAVSIGVLGVGLLMAAFGWRRRKPLFGVATLIAGVAATMSWSVRTEVDSPFGPGVQLPSEQQAVDVFLPLHANIYRAFDYVEESDIYDALARSVDGDLLANLYTEVYNSLILRDHGGAVSRVERVTPLETSIENIGVQPGSEVASFNVRARWRVAGAVYHWGHSHKRVHEYDARYTVVATDAGWRIAGSEPLGSERVDPGDDVEAPDGPRDDQGDDTKQPAPSDAKGR